VRTKSILVSGKPVKLYSLDGKTWFSERSDYRAFKTRRIREKAICQEVFTTGAELSRRMPDPTTDYEP
jgi:hypothetical protein